MTKNITRNQIQTVSQALQNAARRIIPRSGIDTEVMLVVIIIILLIGGTNVLGGGA